jgi:hypothetical protein
MTGRSYPVFVLIALPAALILVGCSSGKKSFTLKGTVSYQGKPLKSGVVRLHMADKRMAMAMIKPDGSFEATEVFPGEAKVTVERRMGRRAWRQGEAPQASNRAASDSLPAKYKEVESSGLAFTLKPGKPLDLQLE